MKIGIYVFDNVEELDFVGPYEVFSYVNKIEPDSLEVHLLADGQKEIKAYNGLKFHADALINDVKNDEFDILVLAGGRGRIQEMENQNLLEFIRQTEPHLKLLASICTGAFFLGEAGLLEGKKAITHKSAIDELQEKYSVQIIQEKIVKNDKLWMSAGVSSGIDLALEIVKEIISLEIMQKVKEGIEYQQ